MKHGKDLYYCKQLFQRNFQTGFEFILFAPKFAVGASFILITLTSARKLITSSSSIPKIFCKCTLLKVIQLSDFGKYVLFCSVVTLLANQVAGIM